MKVISLKKVTAVVSICIMGSYLVNANENDVTTELKTIEAEVSNLVKSSSDKKLKQFKQLIEKFDLDKNGLLSEKEVQTSKHKKLQKSFDVIDLNKDSNISAVEFNQYITPVK